MTGELPGPGSEDYAAALRQAGIRLAGKALDAAAGGEDAAKALLRPALEAIGLLPYERTPGRYQYGQVPVFPPGGPPGTWPGWPEGAAS